MKDNRLITAALLLLATILLLTLFRYGAAPPREETDGQFSTTRAGLILQQLVGDGVPHPVGSPENGKVRDRIVALLRGYGYEPQIQRAFVCGRNGACATVENVLARHGSGAGGRRAVLVAVHYDSVFAGPGASDDAMAVAAVLEIARMLRAESFPNDIIFLIDDGEEQGLLGARAFVGQHPWTKDVGAVVNIEARGTSGASVMFETSAHNAEVIDIAARAIARPATNSIYYTIYKLLPNDTDFTVFKEFPWIGVNFAIIGNPGRYHTPLDSFENASPASLQHHGDNTLSMVRAFAGRELRPPGGNDAVFFDVFTLGIVWWPEPWTPVIALLTVLLFGAGVILSRAARIADMLLGAAALLAVLAITGLAARLLDRLLGAMGALPVAWIADPQPYFIALWTMPVAAALFVASFLSRRDAGGVWAGVWIVWVLAAAALSFFMPAVSFPLLVPAAVAAIVSIAMGSMSWRWAVVLLPLAAAAVVIFPVATLIYGGMGAPVLPVIALMVALVLTGLIPAATQLPRFVALAPLAVAIIGVAVGLFVPPITGAAPAPAPIILYQDEQGSRRLLLDLDSEPTAAMRAAGFGAARVQPYSWDAKLRPFATEVAVEPLPAPEFRILAGSRERERLTFRGRLVSPRGATTAALLIPRERIERVDVNGTPIDFRPTGSYWRPVRIATLPPEGVEISVALSGGEPVTVYAWDSTPGLPPAANAAVRARGREYVPIGSGDCVVASSRIDVAPAVAPVPVDEWTRDEGRGTRDE